VTIPLLGTGLDEVGVVQSPGISPAIKNALAAVYRAVAFKRFGAGLRVLLNPRGNEHDPFVHGG